MICWRARWLFDKKPLGAVVTPKEAKARDDKRIAKELLNVLKQADFVITYNGDKFDLKKINWLFIKYQLKPVPHCGSIDVMAALKRVSEPTSLALGFIAKELGYDGKLETDNELWKDAERGDKKALDYMYEYNAVDVDRTESVYLHVRPYLKSHPNFAEFLNYYQQVDKTLDVGEKAHRCPRCLTGVIAEEKFTRFRQTPAGFLYKRANCPHCGAVVFDIHKDKSLKHPQKVYVR
jgi:ribosomal protein S27AE